MAGTIGRKVVLEWDGDEILGVREKGVTLGGEAIDVTSDDDDGWRTLIADELGQYEVNISLSGVLKSDVLRAAYFSNNRTATATLTWPASGGSLTGTFMLASYSETGAYNDAVTFEAELQSSGVIVYTPAT